MSHFEDLINDTNKFIQDSQNFSNCRYDININRKKEEQDLTILENNLKNLETRTIYLENKEREREEFAKKREALLTIETFLRKAQYNFFRLWDKEYGTDAPDIFRRLARVNIPKVDKIFQVNFPYEPSISTRIDKLEGFIDGFMADFFDIRMFPRERKLTSQSATASLDLTQSNANVPSNAVGRDANTENPSRLEFLEAVKFLRNEKEYKKEIDELRTFICSSSIFGFIDWNLTPV